MADDGPGDGDLRAPLPSAPTEAMPEDHLGLGSVVGERYQIREQLGRGGMGEVWRAFDLKLQVEVALKALRPELMADGARLELLRQEVRAAREVTSPNVCRVFDLVELDGRELVSMEYVDGATLLDVLIDRAPLEPTEAQDIASQFLAGLEAIHRAGLVHRDVKPENIMITRAGRVVVMDFGLARSEAEGAGSVSGTPAYMAPEQARGEAVDARADLFAAGVVLAEMVSPQGVRDFESRESVWSGVRQEPPEIPESAWRPIVRKAVASDPGDRFTSAHELTRALEDVAFRIHDEEGLEPYPGLSAFGEDDAEYFFGREAEIETVWKRLASAHLSAIVGASGAGKSSFIRAGLLPSRPEGWAILTCTPGKSAVGSLRRAVVPEIEEIPGALRELAEGGDDAIVEAFSLWRRKHGEALLVVDQFEELFTQNSEEGQARVSGLIRRLMLDADVRVLLGMRDDFLLRCHEHEGLEPVFSALTPLRAPVGGALRRAVVQPALRCGYRFEDDELADEILAEVEGERGTLPLLAFALARLWKTRDRDTGFITRRAYLDIGGVGGALAGHAESVLDTIGVERIPIVRELFRNLVTARGTRAVQEWDELLSVFKERQRESSENVLRQLIDARLLTSYEVREEDREPTRRIEIIHESLLANWPRLVRWRTQDADAAQLRDQLRQAASTWDEHHRSTDFLWTGRAYREFEVWRESYPGGLTELENDFASAMTLHAERRKRRRRMATAAVLAIAAAVAVATTALWRRSVAQERRAEAAHLVSLGQLELESNPSSTVAHAIASLEVSDSREARLLALATLWKGPTGFVASADEDVTEVTFTPDGQWLVYPTDRMHVISSDGTDEEIGDVNGGGVFLRVGSEPGVFVTHPGSATEPWALWSAPEKRLLASTHFELPDNFHLRGFDLRRRRVLFVKLEDGRVAFDALGFDGTLERLGTLPFDSRSARVCRNSPAGKWTAVSNGHEVFVIEFLDHGLSDPRPIGRVEGQINRVTCDPTGHNVAAHSTDGRIHLFDVKQDSPPRMILGPSGFSDWSISTDGSLLEANRFDREKLELETWVWSLEGEKPNLLRHVDLGKHSGVGAWVLNPVERQIVSALNPDPKIRVWPLGAPADAAPVIMQHGGVGAPRSVAVHPAGNWVATCGSEGVALWPVARPYPAVIDRYAERVGSLVFGPDGQWLATTTYDGHGAVRVWRSDGSAVRPAETVLEAWTSVFGIAASPNGKQILVGTRGKGAYLLSLDGEAERALRDAPDVVGRAAFSPDGRLAAASGKYWGRQPEPRAIQVWDLQSFEPASKIDLGTDEFVPRLHFTRDGSLLSGNVAGLLQWDVTTGTNEILAQGPVDAFSVSSDEQKVLYTQVDEFGTIITFGRVFLLDRKTGSTTPLASHGDRVTAVGMDGEGTIAVTGDEEGVIRVGPITGEEPHLLLGNDHEVWALAVDPRGRWIASASGTEVRLWPIPDLSKPPLHTLPREELIAKLKTLTNLRIIRDPESSTGWKLTHDPFPGWETVPEW